MRHHRGGWCRGRGDPAGQPCDAQYRDTQPGADPGDHRNQQDGENHRDPPAALGRQLQGSKPATTFRH
jgi:hypothetical protein